MDLINNIKIFLKKEIQKTDNLITKRKRQISFKNLLYFSAYIVTNKASIDSTLAHLKKYKLNVATRSGYIQKRNKINLEYYNNFADSINNYIWKDYKKQRFIAVDGSQLNFNQNKNDFKHLKNYSKSLLSSLFEINTKIPINYGLFKDFNERTALISQLKYINKNDVLVMDRGYYSDALLFELDKRGIDYIFRLKKGLKIPSEPDSINNRDVNGKNIKVRIIQTKIKRCLKIKTDYKEYIFLTSLFNHKFDFFAETYKKRWEVELDFRHIKHNMNCENLKSLKTETIRCDVINHQIVNSLVGYIKYHLEINVKKGHQLNRKKITQDVFIDMFRTMLFHNSTKKILNFQKLLIEIIYDNLIKIQLNRIYNRIKKKPTTTWASNGNPFIKKKKKNS